MNGGFLPPGTRNVRAPPSQIPTRPEGGTRTLDRGEAGIRHLFRRRSDPYAGFDLDRAKRLGGALWLVGAACLLLLLPLAPPTESIGSSGWLVAGGIFAGIILAALRMLLQPGHVGTGELLAMSYIAISMIALLEWLAGGHSSPYDQLYFLSVLYTACVHPPRRVVVYLVAFVAAASISFVYAGWDAREVGDAALQTLLALGLAFLGLILMEGVRAQRTSLREEGEEAQRLANADSLTGLGNRRRLMDDLEARVSDSTPERPAGLILFDLDGFKAYNDTFGHPAGDALLVRLAGNLSTALEDRACTYRMGGDEFCVLTCGEPSRIEATAEAASRALSEIGEGFNVTASCGTVLVPTDTRDAAEALQIADRRMYANKSRARASAGRQTTDVLLRVLAERNPELALHLDDVTQLCDAVGRRMGLPEDERIALVQAASLHDIGKAAIPDAILEKPAELSEEEWEFMRGHTVVGERILSSAPALCDAAKIVRSSHERYNGTGYPDRLAGAEIPLGARIVAVCDAYDAMTSDRPYRAAMSSSAALAELRRCAGSQFDPAVVEAFASVLADREERVAAGSAAALS